MPCAHREMCMTDCVPSCAATTFGKLTNDTAVNGQQSGEEGIIDYNPYISLVTPALIGHTYCVNWEERTRLQWQRLIQGFTTSDSS